MALEADTSEAAADPASEPDDDVETSADIRHTNRGLYTLARFTMSPLARLLFRPRVIGRHNVPKRGPVIIASNHLSFIDSVAIPMVSPRRVRFLAKSSYFDGTGARGGFQRLFFSSVGAIPVVRGAGSAAQAALDQSRRIIESGEAFALYPEGTRSLDGRLYKGRTGAAWLALTTGAPVVPVGLKRTNDFLPVGAKIPRNVRITIEFGKPLDLRHLGSADSGKARRQATDEIMSAIQSLSGQELAGSYNEAPPSGTVERVRRLIPHERR
ncbi:lysophospholipid acyltransferase family protein [Gryllotalpicola protaetiae]|uniref:1-acyl-sn-glycerol-3-phosphate acyltransferase n=1 Tax=Gryllotalpicola protaetiae TaxID=2419771 RepID=A0A387BTU6_9MICO|nr:1-acyl-sn-glycerol-3-phosphate acyltransferase [Gryllotalpicola protaetiae]